MKTFFYNLYIRFLSILGALTLKQANDEKTAVINAIRAAMEMAGVKPADLVRSTKNRKRDAAKIRRQAEKDEAAARKLAAEKAVLAKEAGGIETAADDVLNILKEINLSATTDFDLPSA
ncbi:MAG: hypothetical protein BroJett025_01140 [Patescibacteria group bacterium]|nr:MAG: hypothetical protein BroJett025_01140 [Patescibacteria group bacterium]